MSNTVNIMLPGGMLKEVSCQITLEDYGERPLDLQVIEETSSLVRIAMKQGEYNFSGELDVHMEESFCWIDFSLKGRRTTFINMGTFAGRNSFRLHIGQIEGLRGMLAKSLCSAWWTSPSFPKRLSEIPEWTQLLLCRTERQSVFCMPMVSDCFKADIAGSQDGMTINAHAYDCGLCALHGTLAVFSCADVPFLAVEKGYRFCYDKKLISTMPRKDKQFPEMMEYLGWCSWNAFYHDVDESGLNAKLEEFHEKGIPVKWLLIDDGWSRIRDNKLDSFQENQEKFPEGLKGFTERAKCEYGVDSIGVWHTINGYWDGIAPDGEIAQQHPEMLSTAKDGGVQPGFEYNSAYRFFDTWHQYLRSQGIDFVKVDNQSGLINLIRNSAPMASVKSTHHALECSAKQNFDRPMINCMGMANESEFFRCWSGIARSSDDFFPDREGSFVNHIMQNAYNSVFCDQLFFCDYDMWWTRHESAVVSGVLRAVSGGPVYISDRVGETNREMLLPLIEEDGRILRCDHAAKPARSCLFENVPQESGALKLTNRCGHNAVSAVFNLTDHEIVCELSAEDTECDENKSYLAYLYFEKRYAVLDQPIVLRIKPGNAEVVNLYPIEGNTAWVGPEDKYIGAASGSVREFFVEQMRHD